MIRTYRIPLILLIAGTIACLSTARPAAAEWKESDSTMLAEVTERLFAVIDAPANFDWPPPVHEIDTADIQAACGNAGKAEGRVEPHVIVCRGLMEKVVDGHADRLAFVLGHELAHAIRGHIIHKPLDPKDRTPFLKTAFTRDQEFEADKLGIELAVKAGYSFQKGLDGMKVFIDIGLEHTGDRIELDHPSWKERLAEVDKDRAKYWRAMDAFHSGVHLLVFEQFGAAAACFEQVTKEFPECPEAWANLGYARLMDYCDGLNTDDLKKLGVTQMVVGGFYQRPKWLNDQMPRATNEKLWADATAALQKALALDKSLTLARANLGIAYLVAPEGKDAVTAMTYLVEASKDASTDGSMAPSLEAALLVNAGVAEVAAGESESAVRRFERVAEMLRDDAGPRKVAVGAIACAMHYNRAMLLARSTTRPKREAAVKGFEQYFRTASPNSAWWPLAYERYAALCKDLGTSAEPAEAFQRRALEVKRPVGGVKLDSGVTITLGLPLKELESVMERPGLRAPLYPGLAMMRIIYADQGIRLLGIDRVMAISLYGPKSPAVMVRGAELGSEPKPVRVGMTIEAFEQAIGRHLATKEPFLEKGTEFYVYRDLQLAVRVEAARVVEVVVAIIPEAAKDEKRLNDGAETKEPK